MIRRLAYVAALCAGPVAAQDAAVDCTSSDLTMRDMIACANISYQAAEEDLAKAHRRARRFFQAIDEFNYPRSPDGVDLFDIAHEQWVAYRKAACDSEASINEGGTIQPFTLLSCLDQYTRDRSHALNDFVDAN